MTFNFTKIGVFTLFLILNSCAGGLPGGDARKNSPDPKERVKKNLETGKGFRLNSLLDKGGNFEFASSNELWKASLDILGFMPLVSANYSGGIIITDWYSENKNDSIKITLRFLSNEVRSDAIDIKIFYKNCNTLMNCTISEKDSELKKELKKEILKKAAIYKKQKVDKNFKPYTPSSLSNR
tara:strand:- start:120 stop:665 length:546 start_codon:yes stop_codon:yes gene_type:complete